MGSNSGANGEPGECDRRSSGAEGVASDFASSTTDGGDAMSLRKVMAGRHVAAGVVVLCMSMFAGSSALGASKGTAPDAVKTSSSGGCGTIPYVAANDPQKLLRSVPKSTRDAY